MIVRDLVGVARPWQWSKNGILFAGLIFSQNLLNPAFVFRSLLATLVFCLASSAVYAVNDVIDAGRDRLHPEKKFRPVATGRVSPAQALVWAGALAAVSGAAGWWLGTSFLIVLGGFFLLNFAYSLGLKSVVVLDVMMIALSFVIRAVAGVMALRPLEPGIEISPWLLVCTLFLALFLGYGKRRQELTLLEAGASGHRATLGQYSAPLLDQLISIVSAATLIGYAIYTVAPETLEKFHTRRLVATVPFVAFGLFRYLFLIQNRGAGGNPSAVLYKDLPLLIAILAWLAVVTLILYVHRV